MQPHLQRVEIEAAFRRNHDLSVDNAAVRQCSKKGVVELGKVAVQRPQVAALNINVALAAIDDGAEAVPLGLVEEPSTGRERLGQLGEHGLDGRFDRE